MNARIIQRLSFSAKFKDFKIQNIVGFYDVKFAIRLKGLTNKNNYKPTNSSTCST